MRASATCSTRCTVNIMSRNNFVVWPHQRPKVHNEYRKINFFSLRLLWQSCVFCVGFFFSRFSFIHNWLEALNDNHRRCEERKNGVLFFLVLPSYRKRCKREPEKWKKKLNTSELKKKTHGESQCKQCIFVSFVYKWCVLVCVCVCAEDVFSGWDRWMPINEWMSSCECVRVCWWWA